VAISNKRAARAGLPRQCPVIDDDRQFKCISPTKPSAIVQKRTVGPCQRHWHVRCNGKGMIIVQTGQHSADPHGRPRVSIFDSHRPRGQ
jgi:hypothetical protein